MDPVVMSPDLQAFVQLFLQYPWFFKAAILMGSLRIIFKPLVSLAQAVVQATPSQGDDAALSKILDSKAFKTFAWLLDYVASIKVVRK